MLGIEGSKTGEERGQPLLDFVALNGIAIGLRG